MSFTSRVGYAIAHPGSMLLWLERKMKRREINPSEGFFGNALLDGLMTYGGTLALFFVMLLVPMQLRIEFGTSMNASLLKMAQWAGLLVGGTIMFSWYYFWSILYPHRFERLIVCMYRAPTHPRERATFRIETHVDDPECCPEGTLVGAPILLVYRHPFFGTDVHRGLRYTLRRNHVLVIQDRKGNRLHVDSNAPDIFDCRYFLLHLVTDANGIADFWGIEYAWRGVMVELLECSSTDDAVYRSAVEIDPESPRKFVERAPSAR